MLLYACAFYSPRELHKKIFLNILAVLIVRTSKGLPLFSRLPFKNLNLHKEITLTQLLVLHHVMFQYSHFSHYLVIQVLLIKKKKNIEKIVASLMVSLKPTIENMFYPFHPDNQILEKMLDCSIIKS